MVLTILNFQVSDGRKDNDIRNRKKDADDEDCQKLTVSNRTPAIILGPSDSP